MTSKESPSWLKVKGGKEAKNQVLEFEAVKILSRRRLWLDRSGEIRCFPVIDLWHHHISTKQDRRLAIMQSLPPLISTL